MRSHFLLLVVFAVLVSIVFAVLQKDTPREQVRLAAAMAAAFVGFAAHGRLADAGLSVGCVTGLCGGGRPLWPAPPVLWGRAPLRPLVDSEPTLGAVGQITDKHEHFVAYGVLAALLLRALPSGRALVRGQRPDPVSWRGRCCRRSTA